MVTCVYDHQSNIHLLNTLRRAKYSLLNDYYQHDDINMEKKHDNMPFVVDIFIF